MIRRARPADVTSLVAMALRALGSLDTGTVVVSKKRIELTARRLVSDPQSLVLVHENNDIDGAIAVSVTDSICFERKIAGIVLWYAEVSGTGATLLRQALMWSAKRPAIKAVGLSMDFGGDERIGKLLERAGLNRRGSVYARY